MEMIVKTPSAVQYARDQRQRLVRDWVARCFGPKVAASLVERAARLFEEGTELAQACGLTREKAMLILDRVYAKPPGVIAQEIGGVSTTLLVLAEHQGLSADACEAAELNRILDLPPEHFRARQAAKAREGMVVEEAA